MRKFEGNKLGFRKAYVFKHEPFIWDTIGNEDMKKHKRKNQSRKDKLNHRNKKNNKYKITNLQEDNDAWVDKLLAEFKKSEYYDKL